LTAPPQTADIDCMAIDFGAQSSAFWVASSIAEQPVVAMGQWWAWTVCANLIRRPAWLRLQAISS